MNLTAATLTFLLAVMFYYGCSGQILFFPVDVLYPIEQLPNECPESCPANSEPICTSNGFCIKLFDSPCQVVYFNCKNNAEYKQVHEDYCKVQKFENLQPAACFNDSLTAT